MADFLFTVSMILACLTGLSGLGLVEARGGRQINRITVRRKGSGLRLGLVGVVVGLQKGSVNGVC